MSRQAKQILAAAAKRAAESDSFVANLLLGDIEPGRCNREQFLEVLAHFEDICAKKPIDQRAIYVEQAYARCLTLLSEGSNIPMNRIDNLFRQIVVLHPTMAMLDFDELQKYGVKMKVRSLIIHFDMSGSMQGSRFPGLVRTTIDMCAEFRHKGCQVYVSMFGGKEQESIHASLGNRMLTLDEFSSGNYQPQGSTAFCPSFERSKQFHEPYDAIIISDGEFTDDTSKLAFQDQCKTVFFVAPPWSPPGVEEKHAQVISNCVHSSVPYIGIPSEKYSELAKIINEHHSFVDLSGFISIGKSVISNYILAPTRMINLFNNCFAQGENQLQILTKKIIGLFRYLEETAKLNFERCIRGDDFRSIMSLVIPLKRVSEGHLEESAACRQLYGYLSHLFDHFCREQENLLKKMEHDAKAKFQLIKIWDEAMSFSERELIIEENVKNYGAHVGYLNFRLNTLNCSCEALHEALKQIRTIYAPENLESLSLILELFTSCKIDDKPLHGSIDEAVLIWRKPDGTIDLLSALRQLPSILQQYEQLKGDAISRSWTFQSLTAIRLAWVMRASGLSFPSFIGQALPALLVPRKVLVDLDQNDNRANFWLKIIREISSEIQLPSETAQLIHQILTGHAVKNFHHHLTDQSIEYEKQIYEDVSPFIDTDDPRAWCMFVDDDGSNVHGISGQLIQKLRVITSQRDIDRFYEMNLRKHGSVIRPRYLTLSEYPNLPDGAIVLYDSGIRKDVDLLREQLSELLGDSGSTIQINAHIHTIRDRLQSIPTVLWTDKESIAQTVVSCKAACQGATLPTEKVTINITKSVIIDYCVSQVEDSFVRGVIHGLSEYSRISTEEFVAGMSRLDYAIECGQKALTTPPAIENRPFTHIDKPGVRQCLEKQYKKLLRSLRSVTDPPRFMSMATMLEQIKTSAPEVETLGFADLESIPEQTKEKSTAPKQPAIVLNEILFTCPITLDIMDNPVTTNPCGHVFEKEAIEDYLKKIQNQCPICRTPITNIIQNFNFKSVIEAWKMQNNQ